MFYIRVSNGLLKDGHRKRMGAAVWEYMWCLDRITRIDQKGRGIVLGGKPIKLDEMAATFGVHRDTISENLKTLEEQGYIERVHAPYGIVLRVMKAKKRFGEKTEPVRENTEPSGLGENTEPNKTITKTITRMTGESAASAPPTAKAFFESKEQQEATIAWIVGKGATPEAARHELEKFIAYWTEPNKSGRKVRWEGERYFDIRRRLITWLKNASRFSGSANEKYKVGAVGN